MSQKNSTLVKEFQKNPENPAIAKEIIGNVNVMKEIVVKGLETINMADIKPIYDSTANEIKENLKCLRADLKTASTWTERKEIYGELKEQQKMLNDITKDMGKTKRNQNLVKGGIVVAGIVGTIWVLSKCFGGGNSNSPVQAA